MDLILYRTGTHSLPSLASILYTFYFMSLSAIDILDNTNLGTGYKIMELLFF